MLRRARSLARAARNLAALRPIVEFADRTWWARVIRRADLVDTSLVGAQLGAGVSRRAAVRRYVRGGFRQGLMLNPLFADDLVSGQLSDRDRVPALYAYLVNDPRDVQVSAAWDAPAVGRARPEASADPAGPLGLQWRRVRSGGPMLLGTGADGEQVRRIAVEAVRVVRGRIPSRYGDLPVAERTVVWAMDADEPSPSASLRDAVSVSSHLDASLLVVLETPSAATLTAVTWLAAQGLCAVQVSFGEEANAEARSAVGSIPRGIVLVRGASSVLDAAGAESLMSHAASRKVAPLWVSPDGVIASAGTFANAGGAVALLTDHPVEDARRLGTWIDVPAAAGPTYALPADPAHRVDADRTLLEVAVTAPTAVTVAAPPASDQDIAPILATIDLDVVAWSAARPVIRRRTSVVTLPDGSRVPSLRWAVKTAAPAGPAGEAWGDTHYARGIAAALRRLGQDAVVDSITSAGRSTEGLDDVALALRGPKRLDPSPKSRNLLWVISHPQDISSTELDDYEEVYAASRRWSRLASHRFARPIAPLLQCTDAGRFRPRGTARTQDIVFVGTARGIARPSVVEPIVAGLPVQVYGPDWRGYIPAANIVATGIPNTDLSDRYESAWVVLNDHWPAMQREGFISNRLYDVVASGGRAISDHVDGIDQEFGGAVRTYTSIPELIGMLRERSDDLFPGAERLAELSSLVRRRDSFDARARELLARALQPES